MRQKKRCSWDKTSLLCHVSHIMFLCVCMCVCIDDAGIGAYMGVDKATEFFTGFCVCDLTYLSMGHVLFSCGTCRIYLWDITYLSMGHDLFIFVTWHSFICVTWPYVSHDWSTFCRVFGWKFQGNWIFFVIHFWPNDKFFVTLFPISYLFFLFNSRFSGNWICLTHIFFLIRFNGWYGHWTFQQFLYLCQYSFINGTDMTHSNVGHDSFTSVMRLSHLGHVTICDMTHSYVGLTWLIQTWVMTHSQVWCDWVIWGT